MVDSSEVPTIKRDNIRKIKFLKIRSLRVVINTSLSSSTLIRLSNSIKTSQPGFQNREVIVIISVRAEEITSLKITNNIKSNRLPPLIQEGEPAATVATMINPTKVKEEAIRDSMRETINTEISKRITKEGILTTMITMEKSTHNLLEKFRPQLMKVNTYLMIKMRMRLNFLKKKRSNI